MTAAVQTRGEGVWSRCVHTWEASLPGMTDVDFQHEAGRVALIDRDSAGRRFMRAAIDTEQRRRAVRS